METPTTGAAGSAGAARVEDFDPFSDSYLRDPYAFYSAVRAQTPAFYDPKIDYWVITRYADVRECFRNQDDYSASIALNQLKPLTPGTLAKLMEANVVPGPVLVNEDPPIHAERRRALMQAFTPQKIRALEPRVRQICTDYIDRMVMRGHADLVADFTWEIPALVIFNFTGVPDEEVSICKAFATSHALFNWGFPSDAEQERLAGIISDYWKYAKMHVARLSTNLGDDFISNMIRVHQEKPDLFDENYLVWMTMNFTFAGHETTTAASANMLRALLEDRRQWEELCADPLQIPNAVEECLRYSSSVIAWRRLTRRPVVIGSVAIPEGAKLLILSASANHDETQFPDGDRLDIHRTNANQHLSFGFGAHLCMGAPLARIEMRIMLEELTRRLPHLRLVDGQSYAFSPNTSFRGPKSLLAEWDPAQNPLPQDRPGN